VFPDGGIWSSSGWRAKAAGRRVASKACWVELAMMDKCWEEVLVIARSTFGLVVVVYPPPFRPIASWGTFPLEVYTSPSTAVDVVTPTALRF
jgi:hypothetical protein